MIDEMAWGDDGLSAYGWCDDRSLQESVKRRRGFTKGGGESQGHVERGSRRVTRDPSHLCLILFYTIETKARRAQHR